MLVSSIRTLVLAELASGEYHDVELRYNPPGTAPEAEVKFVLDVNDGPLAAPASIGFIESPRDGVLSNLGDDYYQVILFGGYLSEASVPDDTVEYSNLQYAIDGRRYAESASALAFNDQDSAAATLGAGEHYWAIVSLSATGITITKSLKQSGAPDTSVVPDPPAGEIAWFYVFRDDLNIINDADITRSTPVGQFQQSTSGTTLTLGPGRALVGNRVVTIPTQTPLSLTPNATNRTWVQPDGGRTVTTTADPPVLRAYLLWTHVTDGAGVSSFIDHREPIGGQLQPAKFFFATVPNAAVEYSLHQLRRDAYLIPEKSASIVAAGTPTGNTVGQVRFDFEFREPGAGSWTSLFTVAADQPSLSINVGEDYDGFADAMLVPARSALRCTVTEVAAYDGTAPTNVLAELPLEIA